MIATAQSGGLAWAARKLSPARLTAQQARAVLRLREIAVLSAWRARHGVDLLTVENFVHVIIDALAHASDVSRRCVCLSDIRALLPRGPVALDMREAQILFLISNVSLGERLMSATEAGRAVELVEIERAEIESEGLVIQTLYPRDETAFPGSQSKASQSIISRSRLGRLHPTTALPPPPWRSLAIKPSAFLSSASIIARLMRSFSKTSRSSSIFDLAAATVVRSPSPSWPRTGLMRPPLNCLPHIARLKTSPSQNLKPRLSARRCAGTVAGPDAHRMFTDAGLPFASLTIPHPEGSNQNA